MVVIQLVVLAVVFGMLIRVSFWVWQDAKKRAMSPRWGIGAGLMLIFFLPLYFLVRKPMQTVKCAACGSDSAASLAFCGECGQSLAQTAATVGNETQGRPGRIFG
jgi:hypothetical protein